MRNLINLVRNENMKLAHHTSTWVMMGIMVILIVVAGLVTRFAVPQASASNWKADITTEDQFIKQMIAKPETVKTQKDAAVKQLQTNEYRLKHDVQPIQSNSLWGFVEGIASNFISLIALFAIVMGGGIVANEFSGGTIKPLLIRPSKRWKILLSKYIAVIEHIILMLLVLLALSFILGGILFSFKGAGTPLLTNSSGVITEINMVSHIVQLYGLESINLLMMVTLSFMISTVFHNSAMAIGIGVFLLTVGNVITVVLARYDWSKYILFANTNLNQYISGEPLVKGMTMTFSITVLIVYFIIFNTISYIGFTKRDIVA
ncbi:ABC transporter permease [Clostridium psychrophilum]|uniref:ABC transporter permease n=1 Tax=Clostridium psychrophilum TaxID=132926 RepID=UPI001C0B3079|nr:ABC transporter permease [Clostridium psychrophilum]MBU3180272.1 ABC transporter permease [Clostridium psychrophilum]